MFKVENVEATAVTSNSFKANWQALEGAQSYEQTVKKRTIDTTPCVDVCDFTGKALPEGWTGKTSSYFSANGYYGTSAPSVSLLLKTTSSRQRNMARLRAYLYGCLQCRTLRFVRSEY